MKIKAYIDKGAAIKAGSNDCGNVEREIDVSGLTPAERETLAGAIGWHSDALVDYKRGVLDLENIRVYLAERAAAREKDAEKNAVESARKLADYERIIRDRKMKTYQSNNIYMGDDSIRYEKVAPDLDEYCPSALWERADVVAWQTELDAINAAAEAVARTTLAERVEAKAAAAAAEDAERKTWIAAHGSQRLKSALKEEIECGAIYRDERLALERPGWSWEREMAGEYSEPRNPSAKAFDLLEAARKTEPKATLKYWERDAETDEDGNEIEAWRGSCAIAEFLGREIVFGLPEELKL